MKNKYKICVYAISKNEEKFVKRWYESMKEADEIYVLDTGSTDNTVNILKSLNVKVIEKEIKPWRFDVARNESLNLLPKDTDICICTDLDEVFNPGWRNELESAWKPNTTRIRYNYNWLYYVFYLFNYLGPLSLFLLSLLNSHSFFNQFKNSFLSFYHDFIKEVITFIF